MASTYVYYIIIRVQLGMWYTLVIGKWFVAEREMLAVGVRDGCVYVYNDVNFSGNLAIRNNTIFKVNKRVIIIWLNIGIEVGIYNQLRYTIRGCSWLNATYSGTIPDIEQFDTLYMYAGIEICWIPKIIYRRCFPGSSYMQKHLVYLFRCHKMN